MDKGTSLLFLFSFCGEKAGWPADWPHTVLFFTNRPGFPVCIDFLDNYLVLQSYYEMCLTFACIEMTTSNLDIDTMLESLTLEEKASHVFIN